MRLSNGSIRKLVYDKFPKINVALFRVLERPTSLSRP
jgi:hypothetical protein